MNWPSFHFIAEYSSSTLQMLAFLCMFSGAALIDVGEGMKRMAEVKDSLDIDVKQNFIDPLQAVADKDIKDIQVKSKGEQHVCSMLLHIQAWP